MVSAMPTCLPSSSIGGTLTSTRYNVLGDLTLNGGILTQAATDGPGAYEGYQFRRQRHRRRLGRVSDHRHHQRQGQPPRHRNTTFDVADAATGADLTVSAGLKNPSSDLAGTVGNLTKDGLGTMVLGGINTYTGNTTVNAGTLALADNAQLRFAIGATSGTNNSLSGSGTVTLEGDFAIDTTAAAALTAGTWVLENVTSLTGCLRWQLPSRQHRRLAPGRTPVRHLDQGRRCGKTWTFDETTGTLTLAVSGYDSWATQIPDVEPTRPRRRS